MKKTYIYIGIAMVVVIGGLLYMVTMQNNKSNTICADKILDAKKSQKQQSEKQIKKLEDTNKKLEEELKQLKNSGTNVTNNNENTNVQTNNYTKIFASEDEKYVLVLTEFNRKPANPKMDDTVAFFTLSIVSSLDTETLYGSYRLENGAVILYSDAGCLTYPNKDALTCALPANVKTETHNNGSGPTVTLPYTNQSVMLGDVTLYLK